MEEGEVEKLFDECLRQLSGAGVNMRCNDLTKLLQVLRFSVRDGGKGGHKLFSHPGLTDFLGSSFNCGHGKNPEIKRPYIRNVHKILKEYEDQIKEHLRRAER